MSNRRGGLPATSPVPSNQPRGNAFAPLFLVASLWVVWVADLFLPTDLAFTLGVQARDLASLHGVITYPLVHGDFAHLAANSMPLLVLGFLVALGQPHRFLPVTLAVWVGSGLALWVLGPANTVTIGASGIVFGYFGYLIIRPFRQDHIAKALLYGLVAALVIVVYGLGMLFGVIPGLMGANISWQAHLFGLLCGVGIGLRK